MKSFSAATRRTCTQCSHILRRTSRQTFLERQVLSRLGFFPWECVNCREVHYLRHDGRAGQPAKPLLPAHSGLVVGRR